MRASTACNKDRTHGATTPAPVPLHSHVGGGGGGGKCFGSCLVAPLAPGRLRSVAACDLGWWRRVKPACMQRPVASGFATTPGCREGVMRVHRHMDRWGWGVCGGGCAWFVSVLCAMSGLSSFRPDCAAPPCALPLGHSRPAAGPCRVRLPVAFDVVLCSVCGCASEPDGRVQFDCPKRRRGLRARTPPPPQQSVEPAHNAGRLY